MSKIIQITSAFRFNGRDGGEGESTIYGLDKDGNLFYLRESIIEGADEWVFCCPSGNRRKK